MVKSLAVGLVLVFLWCALATAQATQPAPAPTAAEKELFSLSQEWMQAVKDRDEKRLNQLMDEHYTLGSVGDTMLTPRDRWIQNSMTRIVVQSFQYEKIEAHVYGKVGFVISLFTFKATVDGKPLESTSAITDVWIRKGGAWKVFSRRVLHLSKPLQKEK